MYLEFFKLKEYPFRLTPDTDFLYMSDGHARAKAYMDYTVWNRDGFVVITGEVGCGKTTLIQKLLSELDESVVVAKIFQTQLDEVEFLQAALVDFGLNPFNAQKVELMDMLNTFCVDNFMQLKQPVLIVDDAHNLSMKVLEEIRLLSGLETRKEKVLHVILVGQPQLNETLELPEMEQLLQRVRLRYHIKALLEKDCWDYIRHRLRVAGVQSDDIFAADTLPVIHKYTGGVPRLINTLCDTAMTCAYADNLPAVSVETLNAAVEELQWMPYAKRISRQRVRKSEPRNGERDRAMEEGLGALRQINAKLEKLDSVGSALASISARMAGIESLLKIIAGASRSHGDESGTTLKKVK